MAIVLEGIHNKGCHLPNRAQADITHPDHEVSDQQFPSLETAKGVQDPQRRSLKTLHRTGHSPSRTHLNSHPYSKHSKHPIHVRAFQPTNNLYLPQILTANGRSPPMSILKNLAPTQALLTLRPSHIRPIYSNIRIPMTITHHLYTHPTKTKTMVSNSLHIRSRTYHMVKPHSHRHMAKHLSNSKRHHNHPPQCPPQILKTHIPC